MDKILELDHELEAVPSLRYKVDSNHDIVYLDFEEPTLTIQEIRAIFRKLGLEPRVVGAVPSTLNPKEQDPAAEGLNVRLGSKDELPASVASPLTGRRENLAA